MHSTNLYGHTPLHCAARQGATAAIFELFRSPSLLDVNAVDAKGNTPLHLACRQQYNDKVVNVLVDHGANVNAQNHRRETPLVIACQNNVTSVILAVIACGGDPNIPDDVRRGLLLTGFPRLLRIVVVGGDGGDDCHRAIGPHSTGLLATETYPR